MPVSPKPVPPDRLLEARRLYEHTRVPVSDICAMLGIGNRTFYTRVHKWKWKRRIDRIPTELPGPAMESPMQASPPAELAAAAAAAADRTSLALRLMSTVERQMAALERIAANLSAAPEHAAEAERVARALASLSRTAAELQKLGTAIPQTPKPAPDEDEDGLIPDVEQLRQELSAELERLAAGRTGETPGELA